MSLYEREGKAPITMKFFSQHLSKSNRASIMKRLSRVVDREAFINGPEVAELERKLSAYFSRPAATCNSGTDALVLGLKALGIGPGDEVITTAFTYFASVEAIAAVGATPVLVDIDLATFNIDPRRIGARVTRRSKAVLIVHLYGLACDMPPIVKLCRERGLALVEDCAQSFGARNGGKLTGTFGDVGCFSFFPTKNLGGFGDGGAATFRSKAVERRFRLLKNHGQPKKYVHAVMGGNSRLDTIQAAVLLEKLARLEDDLEIRRKRAAAWLKRLSGREDVLATPTQPGHTFNVFSVLVRDRSAYAAELDRAGIPWAVYYDLPVYRQGAYRTLFGRQEPLPNAEFAAKHVISLPIH